MVILPNLGTFEEKHIKNSIDAYINTYFSVGYFKSNKEFKLIYFVNQERFQNRREERQGRREERRDNRQERRNPG